MSRSGRRCGISSPPQRVLSGGWTWPSLMPASVRIRPSLARTVPSRRNGVRPFSPMSSARRSRPRAALPALVRAGGHLVLTGSVAGRGGRIGSLYSATKWAVTALSQSIRAECAGSGVRVTLIQPGLVNTEPSMAKEERRHDPKLEPSDIARAVLFAVGEPRHVDVSEIVIRPAGAGPYR